MTCAGCGHDIALHGRRGHGSCRHFDWTEHGRREASRISTELRAEGKDETVIAVVLRTLVALSGMHEDCKCKRFRKTPAKEATSNT